MNDFKKAAGRAALLAMRVDQLQRRNRLRMEIWEALALLTRMHILRNEYRSRMETWSASAAAMRSR